MPLIEIPGKGLVEFPYDMSPQDITAAVQKLSGGAPAEARPPGPGVPAGEGAPKPSFLRALGGAAKERLGEIGQMPMDLAKRAGKDVATGMGFVPGPLGALTSAGGSLLDDVVEGKDPSLQNAALAGGTSLALGGLGKLAGPLSKLRIMGTGKAKDAALAADAVRGAGTALQPGGTAAELMDTMRGVSGTKAMGERLGSAREALSQRLPTQAPKGMPMIDTGPLSREQFAESTGKLTDLGERGFNLKGAARDSPLAQRARRQYGAERKDLESRLGQTGPENLDAFNSQQRDFSAAHELRRLFRGNTGEGPDRVFRPNGFNLQDVQERAGKRVGELQGRLGQESADELLRKLYRGGKPGQGTDRPLSIGLSKFKGMSLPTGLERLAGPGMDPQTIRMLQMLLQGGGTAGLDALQ